MPYIFFFISTLSIWIVFALGCRMKQPGLKAVIIGISSIAFSFSFDIVFGAIQGLYYYITPNESLTYITISAILLYPLINILYTMFLPAKRKHIIPYTVLCIAAMLLFEYLSVKTGTIVFTGWQPIPWSLIVYVITFYWVYALDRYLSRVLTMLPRF